MVWLLSSDFSNRLPNHLRNSRSGLPSVGNCFDQVIQITGADGYSGIAERLSYLLTIKVYGGPPFRELPGASRGSVRSRRLHRHVDSPHDYRSGAVDVGAGRGILHWGKLPFVGVRHQTGFPNVSLPAGWNRQVSGILFLAPPGYPAAQPDCFWVEPDAACLEASLLVEGFADDKRGIQEWLSSVSSLYDNPLLDGTLPYPNPKGHSCWFHVCVRQIRRYARQWECQEHQYAAALAVALLRKAVKDKDAPEPESSRRAVAYVLAERVLLAISSLSAQAPSPAASSVQ